MDPSLLLLLLTLAGASAFAGLAAGFFGIGGGLIIVPVFYYILGSFGFPDSVRMHMAVGTSLAMIAIISLRSVKHHAHKGSVDKLVLKAWLPLIAAGSLLGSLATQRISGHFLTGLFGCLTLLLAFRFAFLGKNVAITSKLPKGFVRLILGLSIGFFSTLMGIGGGVFGITLMTLCSMPVHRAIGTAAGFGAVVGTVGTLGFILSGWGIEDRPPFSLGYVSLPGFFIMSVCASLTTPLGVSLVHKVSEHRVRLLLALLLTVNSLIMLTDTLKN